MPEPRFDSSLLTEEIEDNFKNVDFYAEVMHGLREALAHAKIDRALHAIQMGYPQRSMIFYSDQKSERAALTKQILNVSEDMGIPCICVHAKKDESFLKCLLVYLAESAGATGAEGARGGEDLTSTLVELGRAAKRTGSAVYIYVDEMQLLKSEEITVLTMAIHRCNQLRLPVLLVGIGTPVILKAVGKACPYADRLFQYSKFLE